MKRDKKANQMTLKVAEAAELVGCGERAIRRGVAEGKIPCLRFSRNILIPKAALVRWVESCGKTEGAA